jgi:flagellar biogenesis protein FliO
VRQGWQRRGLVFMTTALILAIVIVLVLAFTAQRLLNTAG